MLKTIIVIFLFLNLNALAQNNDINADTYSARIDSTARSVKYSGSIEQLSYDLTKNCQTQLDKARAIFIWISDNIKYDHKFVNHDRKIKFPKCKKGQDCAAIYNRWEDDFLKKTVSRKKAVCEGYARLFKKLCDHAGLQSSIISGYTKQEPGQVGSLGPNDHAWNVVKIDGKYHFFDVTWASGYCLKGKKGKLKKFTKRYNNYYWDTPIEKLCRNHFPAKEEDWLQGSDRNKEKYRNNAYIAGGELPYLELIEPQTGMLEAKKGDTLRFRFHYSKSIDLLQVNTNIKKNPEFWREEPGSNAYLQKLAKQEYIPFKHDGGLYEFTYVLADKKVSYIDVLFEHNHVIRFKIQRNKD